MLISTSGLILLGWQSIITRKRLQFDECNVWNTNKETESGLSIGHDGSAVWRHIRAVSTSGLILLGWKSIIIDYLTLAVHKLL
jgi:hypothetical protein